MSNELEKKFFDTFGIEPREFKSCDVGTFCPYPEKECGTDTCPYYKTYKVDYPAISDSILLELICICCKAFNLLNIELSVVFAFNIDEIKQSILTRLIWLDEVYHNKDIKHQVRTLFEEG